MTTATSTVEQALEHLVRQAMATGAHYFVDAHRTGTLDLQATMLDAFGDQPASFLAIRGDLTEPILKPTVTDDERDALAVAIRNALVERIGAGPGIGMTEFDLADIVVAEGWHR